MNTWPIMQYAIEEHSSWYMRQIYLTMDSLIKARSIHADTKPAYVPKPAHVPYRSIAPRKPHTRQPTHASSHLPFKLYLFSSGLSTFHFLLAKTTTSCAKLKRSDCGTLMH